MKTAFSIAVVALLLVVPSQTFAMWRIATVSKEQAKEMGMEVRLEQTVPNHVRVELEFMTEGRFEEFSPERKFTDHSRVELRIGERDNPSVTATLREDRSKPGRVVIRLTADRTELDKLTLWVMVPGALGGSVYDLRVKEFVE